MREILVVLDAGSEHETRVQEAVNLVNGSQRFFFMKRGRDPIQLGEEGGALCGDSAAAQLAAEFPNQKVICITDRRFDDNWFSHEYRHCAVISTADWEQHFAPPSLRCYLVYQIAQALVPMEADLTEEMLLRLVHEPPIGCMHDLNARKPEIKYGMRAGNMCPACEGGLREFGVDPSALDAVRRILSVVRDEAIGRPRIVDPFAAFVVMRFSQNDENDNAYRYGVRPGLEDVGLTAHRADDTVQSTQILDKVFRHLERSRFIVAKVDAENLNVYFELGLAMGLNKDVLLISESTLVVSLPSDLRNWECLTYQKGNYEQLRQRVADFFRANYHLGREDRAT
jgi:hypothetical protein